MSVAVAIHCLKDPEKMKMVATEYGITVGGLSDKELPDHDGTRCPEQ
jgi:hypothetical protein